jgi:hypothetical protein
MTFNEADITSSVDMLIAASREFEKRLEDADINAGHDFAFATREMLYDLRRLNIMLSDAMTESESAEALPKFYDAVKAVLYEFLPHIEGHMSEIEAKLDILLPEPISDED